MSILADHNKYVGFLYLYSTYNNAVVHVFIQLLKNSVATDASEDEKSTEIHTPEAVSNEDSKQHDGAIELVQVENPLELTSDSLPRLPSREQCTVYVHVRVCVNLNGMYRCRHRAAV